ncbi:MAG: HPr kinase/phosphorylase [Spirochaetes bacterium GWB1_48_6]|nr:MAG: HPr kinase/phosphorylase [Spirochaetes bacterium GWB1_48_6]
MSKVFTVLDLIDLDLNEQNALLLRCLAGRKGLVRPLRQPDLNRPGLALGGFFNEFAASRIQIFGQGETAYLKMLEVENRWDTVERLLTFDIPCCIFTHQNTPHPHFIELAEKHQIPILQSDLSSADFTIRIMRALGEVFAPRKTIHGVLVEVSGVGVLILGESGVGKSETALELIERRHRLVGDDAIEVRCVGGNTLLGKASNPMLGHHLEVRGLGIINIAKLFGIDAIQKEKEISLVVDLEFWDSTIEYERLGTKNETYEILGVHVPYQKIPVKPGRNIAIIIETAAMNERLKNSGFDAAQEFSDNIVKWLESENARSLYLRKNKNTP